MKRWVGVRPAVIAFVALGCGVRVSSPGAPARAQTGTPCETAKDCPRPEGPCFQMVCVEGTCQSEVTTAGAVPAEQKAGDCQELVCDGRGQAIPREDRGDVPPSDDNECTDERCASGEPEHAPLAAGAVCGKTGLCNGAGLCGVCLPGARRCEHNASETCEASGRWSEAAACAGGAPVCSGGACAGIAGIALGDHHGCAWLSDGVVRCWGANRVHQADGGARRHLNLGGALELALGQGHACARLQGGAVRCWGANSAGELGDGTEDDRATPVEVLGLKGAAQIAAGAAHTCARLNDGTVACWGKNQAGQLGDGSAGPRSPALAAVPGPMASGPFEKLTVVGLAPATRLELGGDRSCALSPGLSIDCWGGADLLPRPAPAHPRPAPKAPPHPTSKVKVVRGLKGVVQIALGGDHSCARLGDGSIQCWGDNAKGQIGDGSLAGRPAPAKVPGVVGAAELALGRDHTCARLQNGSVQCWGGNAKGQLGDGTRADRKVPGPVPLAGVIALAAAGDHTCARMASGEVRCWGDNDDGALGDGTAEARPIPTVVTW